jgi:hypothetical protein
MHTLLRQLRARITGVLGQIDLGCRSLSADTIREEWLSKIASEGALYLGTVGNSFHFS